MFARCRVPSACPNEPGRGFPHLRVPRRSCRTRPPFATESAEHWPPAPRHPVLRRSLCETASLKNLLPWGWITPIWMSGTPLGVDAQIAGNVPSVASGRTPLKHLVSGASQHVQEPPNLWTLTGGFRKLKVGHRRGSRAVGSFAKCNSRCLPAAAWRAGDDC